MKIMKKMTKHRILGNIVLIGLLLTLHSGCSYALNGVKGDGNVVKQERSVSDFNGIDVGGAFRVFLTQGSSEKLVLEADENLLEIIETKVKGGVLHINTTKDIKDFDEMNVYITFKDLSRLDISGACKLSGEDKFKFNDLEIDGSGASSIELKFSAADLDLDFSGASNIELYGGAEKMTLDLSGASTLEAYDFETNYCNADISGASHAYLTVNNELSAEVSGAGGLKYKGNATLIHHDVSGAGSLKKL